MKRDGSFVQAVELWLPQGEVLAWGAGAYRGQDQLERDRRGLAFQQGEGLPGAVWANGKALLWDVADTFLSPAHAAAKGVDAALGYPLFDGDRLFAVLTVLLSRRTEAPSGLEVWDVTDELDVLKYARGYYVHCAELERFSPWIQFPRGTGLPGLTWLSGQAQVMADLGQSNAFIRAGLAVKCGLKHGLGLPVYNGKKLIQVLALLGAERHSFMSGAEIYYPQGTELGAATSFDWSGRGSKAGESFADVAGRKLAQRALTTRVPALSETNTVEGQEISLALPIHDRKGLKQIVVLRMQ
jgi:hypothetical protein